MLANGPDGEPADLEQFANNIVVTQPATCEKRRPLCVGMGAAFTEAEAYLHDHPAEAFELLKKRFSTLDPAVLADLVRDHPQDQPQPAVGEQEGHRERRDRVNIDAGLMKPEKTPSYDGLATDEFVK